LAPPDFVLLVERADNRPLGAGCDAGAIETGDVLFADDFDQVRWRRDHQRRSRSLSCARSWRAERV